MAYGPRSAGTGLNFKCPKCGGGTGVTDSRPNPVGIRRRRKCYSAACGFRLTTIEVPYEDHKDLDLEVLRHQVVVDMNLLVGSYGKLNRAIKAYAKLKEEVALQTFQKP